MARPKSEVKSRGFNVAPIGVTTKVRPVQMSAGGEKWFWEIKRYGKVVAQGAADTEGAAKSALGNALVDFLEKQGGKNADRNLLRTKLKHLLEKRPYLVAGACELLIGAQASKERLMSEAYDFELAWAEKDPKKYRVPLPTHARALLPHEAAEQFYELVVWLGLVKVDEESGEMNSTRLLKWAREKFGEEKFPS